MLNKSNRFNIILGFALAGQLSWNLVFAQAVANHSGNDYLVYKTSYRGLLSLWLQLDIAELALTMPPMIKTSDKPAEAMLTLNTQDFTKVDMIMPVRFCYRNQFASDTFATQHAEWWGQIGREASKGRLEFDARRRLVIFRHVARKLATWQSQEDILGPQWAKASDPDRYELVFPGTTTSLMDRLAMLQWLRYQTLTPGMQLDPIATDGHKQLSSHIEVEGEEQIEWNGHLLPSLRIRLQPRVRDQEDASPTWVWLSQDTQHLPLLFSSVRAFGTFEVRLVSVTTRPALTCTIPEATTTLHIPNQ